VSYDALMTLAVIGGHAHTFFGDYGTRTLINAHQK